MKLALAGCFVLAIALTACSTGDKGSPEGQADYLERALDILSRANGLEREVGCERSLTGALQDCDREKLRDILATSAQEFEDLRPPSNFVREHRRLAANMRDLSRIVAVPTEDLVDTERGLPDLLNSEEIGKEWQDAAEAHYSVKIFSLDSASMAPTFLDGETFAFPPYEGAAIGRGAIIVFAFHLDPNRSFLKRVIGIPGDTVEVKDGMVVIDGTPLVEDYLKDTPNYKYGPETVPAGHYFVLGDNRRISFDSHAWGSSCLPELQCEFVPQENIIGVLPTDATGAALRGE